MSAMEIIDENGKIKVNNGSLSPLQSEHPVWKARNALALAQGSWLYAPSNGHDLGLYSNAKASPAKVAEFEKSIKFYLTPYGPEIVSRFIGRGVFTIQALITRETLNGQRL